MLGPGINLGISGIQKTIFFKEPEKFFFPGSALAFTPCAGISPSERAFVEVCAWSCCLFQAALSSLGVRSRVSS